VATESINPEVSDSTKIPEASTLENPSASGDIDGLISQTATRDDDEQVIPSDTPQAVKTEPTSAQQAGGGEQDMDSSIYANVRSVQVSGDEGAYQFSVGISSPDTGCDQYADWWEVVSQDGVLIYRRILLHSHVGEQPFVRSGGPVAIPSDSVVIIRAHMNTDGYGGVVFQGSVGSGFVETELDRDFAADLNGKPPLPEGCAH
jgi:hypothetical protein